MSKGMQTVACEEIGDASFGLDVERDMFEHSDELLELPSEAFAEVDAASWSFIT